MVNLGILLLIIILFYFLGRAADIVIINLRKLGEALDIKIFFLGLFLGLFTSLPELAVGINAVVNDIEEVSLGNALGGIIILFGLILGVSSILNRKIKTGGKIWHFLPILIFIFLPLLLGLKGSLGFSDGVILIAGYILLLIYLYFINRSKSKYRPSLEVGSSLAKLKYIFKIIIGVILIIVISNLIIKYTAVILAVFNVPAFFVGLMLFSVGTNLPEITVALRSWRRKVEELSFSNLVGSAMSNILVIGIVASLSTISVALDYAYFIMMAAFIVLFVCLLIFYKTDKKLTAKEGVVLLSIYAIFILLQFFNFYLRDG